MSVVKVNYLELRNYIVNLLSGFNTPINIMITTDDKREFYSALPGRKNEIHYIGCEDIGKKLDLLKSNDFVLSIDAFPENESDMVLYLIIEVKGGEIVEYESDSPNNIQIPLMFEGAF